MLQMFKKLRLSTKLDLETINKYSNQNLIVFIYRLSATAKVYL